MSDVTTADPSPERSDGALARAARLGDEQAFRVIIDRHGPGMYRYALRLVGGSEHDASEVTQEAFISAWRGLGRFRGESALPTWLFSLVHRRSVDLVRTRRPVPIDDEMLATQVPPAQDNPLQDVVDGELLEALQQALDELPWNQRAAWLLREVEGMTYEEIAATLSTTPGSVRGHLHRGRRTLAERMARWR
ncbi:RNA polymerase sigma factor [Nocardioides rotundus]|uniref:RNA polymerase sigma factor n=1 Tax=Nocardioides rotundus TaxID=1774216 RepID=UPI0037C94966